MDYLFPPMVAYTIEGEILRSGTGQVFAESDTSYATPLTVYDLAGVAHTTVDIDSQGVTEAFRADAPVVVWKSGDVVLPIWSGTGMREAAEAAQVAAEAAQAAAEAAAAAAEGAASGAGLLTQTAADSRYVLQSNLGAELSPIAATAAEASSAAADAYAAAVEAAAYSLKGVVLDDGDPVPSGVPVGAIILYRVPAV